MCLGTVLYACLSVCVSKAATKTWIATGVNGNWSTSSNWSPAGQPQNGDSLTFGTSASNLRPTNNIASLRLTALTFSGNGYIVSGNAILLTNGVSVTAANGANTLALGIISGNKQTISLSSGGTLACSGDIALNGFNLTISNASNINISGIISGDGGLIKDGTGRLLLNGAFNNTYTGTTTVNEGTLELNDSSSANAMVPGDVVVNNGAVLFLSEGNQIADGADVTINGGSFILLDVNEAISSLTMRAGTVDTGTGTLTNGNITTLSSTESAVIHGNLFLGTSTRTFNIASNLGKSTADLIINAVIQGAATPLPVLSAGGIRKTGSGELQLNAANTYPGITVVDQGQLTVNNDRALGTSGKNVIPSAATTVNSNAVLLLRNGANVTNELLVLNSTNSAGALQDSGPCSWVGEVIVNTNVYIETSSAMTIIGPITGGGGFTKIGASTLTLAGGEDNTYAGDTTVREGVLQFNKTGAYAISNSASLNISSTVRYLAGNQLRTSVDVIIDSSGSLDLNNFTDDVGDIILNGGFIQTGTGTLQLAGNLSAIGAFNFPIGGDPSRISGKLNLPSTRTFTVSDNPLSLDLQISAGISGAGGFIKNGPGELEVTSSNNFTGPVTVNGGVLTVGDDHALGSTASAVNINNDATLDLYQPFSVGVCVTNKPLNLNSTNVLRGAIRASSGAHCWDGNIMLSRTAIVNVASSNLSLGGIISGSGGITKIGVGSLDFKRADKSISALGGGARNNSYLGTTLILQGLANFARDYFVDEIGTFYELVVPGALIIGDNVAAPGTAKARVLPSSIDPVSEVTVNSSGDLTLAGCKVGSLAGTGMVHLGSAPFGSFLLGITTVGSNNLSTIFSGSIDGDTNGLTKVGTGALVFNGTNTYSGPTLVESGTLQVNGRMTNTTVTVRANATIMGRGSVGPLFVANGGHLRPGASPGTFTAQSAILSNGAIAHFELFGAQLGSEYDHLSVVSSTLVSQARLDISNVPSFHPVFSSSFVITTNKKAKAAGVLFQGLPNGATTNVGGVIYSIDYSQPNNNSNQTRLTVVGGPNVRRVWSGGSGPNAFWNTQGNWVGNGVPVISNHLEFPRSATNGISTNNLTANLLLGSITFSGTNTNLQATPYPILRGNTVIRLNEGIRSDHLDGPGPVLAAFPITLNTNQVFSNESLTVPIEFESNIVAAPHVLTISGPGTIRTRIHSVLSANNNTNLVIDAGRLAVNGLVQGNVFVRSGVLSGEGFVGSIIADGGTVTPGDNGPGRLTSGNVSLTNGSAALQILIAGTNAGVADGYSQLAVTGTVSLANTPLLKLAFTFGGTLPNVGDRFKIIDNDGIDPVSGTFANLAEGKFITNVLAFAITYHGGDGNDVELITTNLVNPIELGQEVPRPGSFVQADINALPAEGPIVKPAGRALWVPSPGGGGRLFAIGEGFCEIDWVPTNGTTPVTNGMSFIWPKNESRTQLYVSGSPPVDFSALGPNFTIAATSAEPEVTPSLSKTNDLPTVSNHRFAATGSGRTFLLITNGNDLLYQVVRTIAPDDPAVLLRANAFIGTNITAFPRPHNQAFGSPFVYNFLSRYCTNFYDPATRTGPIIPVNENGDDPATQMVLVLYQEGTQVRRLTDSAPVGTSGLGWPYQPVHYTCLWPDRVSPPQPVEVIIIGSGGIADPVPDPDWSVYAQNDRNAPGFNPNDEHAWRKGNTVLAVRNDLRTDNTSEPYALLAYRNPMGEGRVKIFRVIDGVGLQTVVAPNQINAFAELNLTSDEDYARGVQAVSGPIFRDYKGQLWAMAGGDDDGTTNIVVSYCYKTKPDFFFPDSYFDFFPPGVPSLNVPPEGSFFPWLQGLPATTQVVFEVSWPALPHGGFLAVGQTGVRQGDGFMRDLNGESAVEVIYQQAERRSHGIEQSVQLIDATRMREVDMPADPRVLAGIRTANDPSSQNPERNYFLDLPPDIRNRIWWEDVGTPPTNKLRFIGKFTPGLSANADSLQLNVLSETNLGALRALNSDPDSAFRMAVDSLYSSVSNVFVLSNSAPSVFGGTRAMTAGFATGTGWVTVAYGNLDDGQGNPVALDLIRVECPIHPGRIEVIYSDNPFDERVTLRHSGDFGGHPEAYFFEWRAKGASDEGEPSIYASGIGLSSITIQPPPGDEILKDKLFDVRYRPLNPSHICTADFSERTPLKLVQGWIKRVTQQINEFDGRISDARLGQTTNDLASLLELAGQRFEGAVPLNESAVGRLGLIEIAETVLKRGIALTIEGVPAKPADSDVVNALLLAAGRLSDLYMLLGNEAFADAADPTIGIKTTDPSFGSVATTLNCFQAFEGQLQAQTILDEELALLRGRDGSPGTGEPVSEPPVYNRLFPNITTGTEAGRAAYSLTYAINPRPGESFDQAASRLYPQGHGDAWGHYLTALTYYYRLLRNPNFTWKPQTEFVTITGTPEPVPVDYQDERRFARAAAARAKTGAEIVTLTYRKDYHDDPRLGSQWQDFVDGETNRAWGVADWASRAGQGAYLDWVTANAMLPPVSNSNGLAKVDRTTVLELSEIASVAGTIQTEMDQADAGMNPLGLHRNAVPFSLSPSELVTPGGKTHFEQISGRALQAVANAMTVFDAAQGATLALRSQADDLAKFQTTAAAGEADFKSRLIEIFGTPYPEDTATAQTEPDLFNYDINDSTPLAESGSGTVALTVQFVDDEVRRDGTLSRTTPKNVTFYVSADGLRKLKPREWSKRKSPGEIQMAHSDLLQALGRFERANAEYATLIADIEGEADLLAAQGLIDKANLFILNNSFNTRLGLNAAMLGARTIQVAFQQTAHITRLTATGARASAVAAAAAAGDIFHVADGIGGLLEFTGESIAVPLDILAELSGLAEFGIALSKDSLQDQQNIQLTELNQREGFLISVNRLQELVRQEPAKRYELVTLQEGVQQASANYRKTLAKGLRLRDERTRFRQQTAQDLRQFRTQDIGFRIFRNAVLQKYRAQFDYAARHVFLAARAYDYETAFRVGTFSHPSSGFMDGIVRERGIGRLINGQPAELTGGLAGIMGQLKTHFDAALPSGLDGVATETLTLSLRDHLFRVPTDLNVENNRNWQERLNSFRVDDLRKHDKFNQFCVFLPTIDLNAASQPPEPGLVIEFSTPVNVALNAFGKPVVSGEPQFNDHVPAHKIQEMRVELGKYNENVGGGPNGLLQNVFIYVVPVGIDVIRPRRENLTIAPLGETREWTIYEQVLPPPFALQENTVLGGHVGYNDPGWYPAIDGGTELLKLKGPFKAFTRTPGTTITDIDFRYNELAGRSVWNTQWLIVIPGRNLATTGMTKDEALNALIFGKLKDPATGERESAGGIDNIKIRFVVYDY